MLSNISQKKQHAVKRIIVNQVEIPKRISNELKSKRFNNDNIKSYDDHSVQSNKEIARQLSNEYLQDCTVHGVKYLGNMQFKTNIFGKLFWATIMICSFLFLAWMLEKFWIRYTTNPVRSVVKSFQAPLFLAPFPAITLCPLIPPLAATRKKLLRQLRLPHNMDNKTAMFLLRYGTAFTHAQTRSNKTHVNNLKALLKMNHMSLMDFLKFLRPCEDLFDYCSWDNVQQNCSEMFKISYTFNGICCSFNYLLEESIETGRTWNDTEFLRTISFGGRSGLLARLHPDLLVEGDEDGNYTKYTTNSAGLVMYVHHPLEYVGPISPHEIIQAKQELRLAVMTKIYHKLSNYYIENSRGEMVSQCVNRDDFLKYFPAYRYTNCFISCSIESVYQACNCVPYYYAPVAKNYSLRICDWEDFRCLDVNKEKVRIIQNTVTENITCECQYPCKNVVYETQATWIDLNNEDKSNISPFYQNNTDAQAILRVFLNFETLTVMETIPIADEMYLLASIGGIFSLFVGCSFISAVEIFYFIGLFLYSSYSNSNKKSK